MMVSRDDAVVTLQFAHHDRGEDARVDIAAAQNQTDLAAAEELRCREHRGKAGSTRPFRHSLLQGEICVHSALKMSLINDWPRPGHEALTGGVRVPIDCRVCTSSLAHALTKY